MFRIVNKATKAYKCPSCSYNISNDESDKSLLNKGAFPCPGCNENLIFAARPLLMGNLRDILQLLRYFFYSFIYFGLLLAAILAVAFLLGSSSEGAFLCSKYILLGGLFFGYMINFNRPTDLIVVSNLYEERSELKDSAIGFLSYISLIATLFSGSIIGVRVAQIIFDNPFVRLPPLF